MKSKAKRIRWAWLVAAFGVLSVLGVRAILSRPKDTPSFSVVAARAHKAAHPKKLVAHPRFQPTPAHPLTILSVGDSLGEDLGFGLQDILMPRANVRLVLDSVGSTGLANQAYYNWPATLAKELSLVHPQVVVILIGGNDAVGFDQNGRPVFFGTSLWHQQYSRRVADMMREVQQAGAHLFWVGLPIMANQSVLSNLSMRKLNRIYYTEAKQHRGVTFVSSWKLFQNRAVAFTQYLSDPAGMTTIVRDPDGVHIAPPAGQELIASLVLAAINRVDHLHLCPNASDFWPEFSPKGCHLAHAQD